MCVFQTIKPCVENRMSWISGIRNAEAGESLFSTTYSSKKKMNCILVEHVHPELVFGVENAQAGEGFFFN